MTQLDMWKRGESSAFGDCGELKIYPGFGSSFPLHNYIFMNKRMTRISLFLFHSVLNRLVKSIYFQSHAHSGIYCTLDVCDFIPPRNKRSIYNLCPCESLSTMTKHYRQLMYEVFYLHACATWYTQSRSPTKFLASLN